MKNEIAKLFRSGDALIHMEPDDFGAYAFVYQSRKGKYHIVINESLSPNAKREVLVHEMKHIIEDMPLNPYIIGIDMIGDRMEIEADSMSRLLLLSS